MYRRMIDRAPGVIDTPRLLKRRADPKPLADFMQRMQQWAVEI
jgi:hypothetical protein